MNELQSSIVDQQVAEQPLHLPAPDHATSAFAEHSNKMLDSLRAEQHHCDDMIAYWTERHADVSRTIEGIQAAHQAIHRVAPRTTSVVTRKSKPKTKEEKPDA